MVDSNERDNGLVIEQKGEAQTDSTTETKPSAESKNVEVACGVALRSAVTAVSSVAPIAGAAGLGAAIGGTAASCAMASGVLGLVASVASPIVGAAVAAYGIARFFRFV